MSYLFENGNIIGQTLDYRSTVVTTYEDEFNSAANVEVVETQSISFDLINSGVDVSSNNELTLSSTLQEGDIIVVQTFMDTGNATDVSDSGSSWVELIGTGKRNRFGLNHLYVCSGIHLIFVCGYNRRPIVQRLPYDTAIFKEITH